MPWSVRGGDWRSPGMCSGAVWMLGIDVERRRSLGGEVWMLWIDAERLAARHHVLRLLPAAVLGVAICLSYSRMLHNIMVPVNAIVNQKFQVCCVKIIIIVFYA